MIKRATILLIILSMMAHCAARLGVLSFLFNKRHQIAYHIGLIAEVPIALCNSDYFYDKEVNFQQQEDEQETMHNFKSIEIELFFNDNNHLLQSYHNSFSTRAGSFMTNKDYDSPVFPISHPPCEA